MEPTSDAPTGARSPCRKHPENPQPGHTRGPGPRRGKYISVRQSHCQTDAKYVRIGRPAQDPHDKCDENLHNAGHFNLTCADGCACRYARPGGGLPAMAAPVATPIAAPLAVQTKGSGSCVGKCCHKQCPRSQSGYEHRTTDRPTYGTGDGDSGVFMRAPSDAGCPVRPARRAVGLGWR